MDFTYQMSISPEDYNRLREAVGWERLVPEQAAAGLAHSALVLGCYDQGSAVGTARIIWDRGGVACLSDVMVLPQYQGQGIGRELVQRAVAYLRSQLKQGWKIKLILVAAKGRESFYESLGFVARPNQRSGAGMELWLS